MNRHCWRVFLRSISPYTTAVLPLSVWNIVGAADVLVATLAFENQKEKTLGRNAAVTTSGRGPIRPQHLTTPPHQDHTSGAPKIT